ncbi:MAG: hypothetical protein MMC33_001190 [Icmadophila ericetorum]|nr:hypothetical protein [Icmadophila ericetorum]
MPSTPHPAQILLSRAHPAPLAEAIFTEKVLHKPLRLAPTAFDHASKDARAQRRIFRLQKREHILRRKKPKPLSAKEKRVQGVYDIPKEARKYVIYGRLHELWLEYIWEILGIKKNTGKGEDVYVSAQGGGAVLAGADFHGAEVEVVRCACVGRVGTRGIVVKETKFTFEIVTRKDELKVVPKGKTVFRFEVPLPTPEGKEVVQMENGVSESRPTRKALVFELHGSQFEARPTDRATKKFKQRTLDEL